MFVSCCDQSVCSPLTPGGRGRGRAAQCRATAFLRHQAQGHRGRGGQRRGERQEAVRGTRLDLGGYVTKENIQDTALG